MVVEYSTKHGIIYIALHWQSTILPDVFRRWDFWFVFLLHVLLAVGFRTGYLDKQVHDFGSPHTASSINWNDIKVITAMTTFFEVFYTNQCFSRYLGLYHVSGKITGYCFDLIICLRIFLGKSANNYTKLATRFVLVSIFLNFYEVHHGDSVTDEEWKILIEHGLLRHSEKNMLVDLKKHQRSHVLLLWASDVTREGLAMVKAPGNTLKQALGPILSMRQDQEDLLNMCALPIPFQYYHLLNAMVLFNLVLWGYAMAICESCFASIIFFMSSVIFMGMLELADELSDPFGDDEVDFPVMNWLQELLDGTHSLLNHSYAGTEEGWQEIVKAEGRRGRMTLADPVTAPPIEWPWLAQGSSAREWTPASNPGQARQYLPLVQQTTPSDGSPAMGTIR